MRRPSRCTGWMLGAALLLAASAAARAAESPGPCQDDVKRLCADVEGGVYSLMRCLSDRRDELDDACRDAVSSESHQARSRYLKLIEACQQDLEQLCPARRGPLHVVQCLRRHEKDLSETCRGALPSRPAGAKAKKAAEPEMEPEPQPGS